MTRARVAAALTGILTVVLLQATLVGPGLDPLPVSLPAVLVAAVALVDGPGAGLGFGFAAGLVADLASSHPAGVLALCWMALGLVAGRLGEHRRLLRDVLTVGVLCGVTSGVAAVLLTVVGHGGPLRDAAVWLAPTIAACTVFALALVPLMRRLLHTEYLRAPHPVYTELVLGPPSGAAK